jgi:hypothetical protein
MVYYTELSHIGGRNIKMGKHQKKKKILQNLVILNLMLW